ncbi:hypothetical protein ELI13_38065 [Rhizobium ruizarguesonis]|uniref:hypothetical protein n=1 Tax=Rhizobium ruizarguesonis TaxID=2081791 RepID=UPI001030669D|nr:hypothetical protein [Rhizobium ruizarguesonis]TAU59251.1 hypothetical protein ELI46_38375 [Rhizobium ruizarguesonis]TAU59303.1 hypothetical protein ELI46_38200 [Rhizobium ruizarguesonis]TAU60937.1 hypothetical protein ELI46_34695 [Rhizobium ruizarguesonis]TAW47873.1 hypothetical protein ELI15_38120 [Rhizobium ruizarguesonis]TAW80974.1 hypothetical protein ELI13_38065 [Rhizobium ruizarguesonis]
MKRVLVSPAVISLAGIWVLAFLANAQGQDNAPVPKIILSAQELRSLGIAVHSQGAEELPHGCRDSGNPDLSVSDEMLRHFKARGFSLESLCLGLSSWVLFDPETGRTIPRVAFSRDLEIPLNLPDCFKNAVPFLDCDNRWVHWEHYEFTEQERKDNLDHEKKVDEMVRNYIARNGVSGVFSIEALGQGVFDSSFEWFLASPELPRGYGYALHGGEGDDPESEDVDLSTYRKEATVLSTWQDDVQ